MNLRFICRCLARRVVCAFKYEGTVRVRLLVRRALLCE